MHLRNRSHCVINLLRGSAPLLREASSSSFTTFQLDRPFTSVSIRNLLQCPRYPKTQTRRTFSSSSSSFRRPHLLTTTTINPTKKPEPPRISIRKMSSSDDTYMSFLEKANADLQQGTATTTSGATPSEPIRTRTLDEDGNVNKIPSSLEGVGETYYVSETDEPFEPVVLGWEGAKGGVWPAFAQFSNLITGSTYLSDTNSISVSSPLSFDPKGRYDNVFSAVREALTSSSSSSSTNAAVEVKVYVVQISHSKTEYWILGLDGGSDRGRIVGVRAKAVES